MRGQRVVEINPHIDVATHEVNMGRKMVIFPYLQTVSITEAMLSAYLSSI